MTNKVVAVVGMRQVGKTTLARALARKASPRRATVFDLERPEERRQLEEPMLILEPLRGLVVIDEIQHHPDLFPILRVLADRPRTPARFLILGSASPDLLRQSTESLAGRIAYHDLDGLSIDEVGPRNLDRLWIRGRLPRSYLAKTNAQSFQWRRDFIRTFLERDLPRLGIGIPTSALRRFWTMLAHYHGSVWNGSEFARSFGVSHTTVRRYLDSLTQALAVIQLQPFSENLRKRQVRSPKIYLSDSGLLHSLLDLKSGRDVQGHPKLGASWEGFLLGLVINLLRAEESRCFFWGTHQGAELDLLVLEGRKRLGFEFKRTDAPRVTKSMQVALEDLKLSTLTIVHAGRDSFPLGKKIRAVSASRLLQDL